MDTLAHNLYLNAYLLSIILRLRPSSDLRCVDSALPVVGGFANLAPEDIAALKAVGPPVAERAIAKGQIICNHLWKAQGPANEGQYFCVGWVNKMACKSGRNPKLDKLDCGFHFTAEQVKNSASRLLSFRSRSLKDYDVVEEAMFLNLAWDRRSSWGLLGPTKQQMEARAMYYRGMSNTNPALDIIRSLRSARKFSNFNRLLSPLNRSCSDHTRELS